MRYAPFAFVSVVACASASPAPVCPTPPAAPTCATAASTTSAPVASAPAAPTASAPPPAPAPTPPALEQALAAAEAATAKNDAVAAQKALTAAGLAAAGNAHWTFLTARAVATWFAHAGDFERAAAAIVAVIPALAKHPEWPDEFWAHNAMMMIREAQGDPAAALAENDQATLAAARGSWSSPEEREKLAFQKDRWHRAYLTRMLAESRTGSVKRALVAYAQAALDDYRTQGFPDSIAILEAYFAALDGKRDEAIAAAKRVDPAKDDDIEDLYLVVVGFAAGGDAASAEAVRKVMRAPGPPRVSRAIMLRWLDLDAKGRGFTPWHASAR